MYISMFAMCASDSLDFAFEKRTAERETFVICETKKNNDRDGRLYLNCSSFHGLLYL